MKISIGRLKEIIMEEVAKATSIEDTLEEKSDTAHERDQDRCGHLTDPGEYHKCMNEYGLEEVAKATEPLDEGLADAVASPFIKLLNTLLPQITPERREAMLKDFEEEVKREAAASGGSLGATPPADKYGGDYDITGIAPQDYELYAESLNIEIVDDE